MKIAIIGGGNMGGAIARGLAAQNSPEELQIYVTAADDKALDGLRGLYSHLHTLTDNTKAARDADIVIIAVKPWIAETVIREIRDQLDHSRQIMVSVVAGLDFDQMKQWLKEGGNADPVLFRVIPNTSIAIGQSMTAICGCNASEEHRHQVTGLFGQLGKTVSVDERQMAAATSLGSCGTAFALRYMRAAMEAGIEMGLYPRQALEIVAQTMKGAAELILSGDNHPEAEIDRVTTPGGITIKGLNAMEEAGFTHAVICGHKATQKK